MIQMSKEELQLILDTVEYHVSQTHPANRTREVIELLQAKLQAIDEKNIKNQNK